MKRSLLIVAVFLPLFLPPRAILGAAGESGDVGRDAEIFEEEGDPSQQDRDAEIFGSEEGGGEVAGTSGAQGEGGEGGHDAEIFGEEGMEDFPSDEEIALRLQETEDFLAIGGEVFLRLDGASREESGIGETTLSSANLLDLYLDARPGEHLRFYARGRLVHDPTVPAAAEEEAGTTTPGGEGKRTDVLLDQLWLKFDAGRRLFFTFGRQRIRWGTGRFWNPTDFLNRQRLDPLAVIDERLGVGLLKLHLPLEALGWNFYAIGNFDEAETLAGVGGALRGEFVFGKNEVTVTSALRKNNPEAFGADFSGALGPFDLHVEGALLHGVETPHWTGELRYPTEGDPGAIPQGVDRSDDWIPQVVAGAEIALKYSDEDSLTLGVEYFYDDDGYGDASLYPWLLANGQFTPLFLGRHYVGGYLLLANPGRWNETTFIVSTLGNLSDRSFLTRIDYRSRFFSHLDFDAYLTAHYGSVGEFRFGLEVPPTPAIPGLEEGIDLPPSRLDGGIGLLIDF